VAFSIWYCRTVVSFLFLSVLRLFLFIISYLYISAFRNLKNLRELLLRCNQLNGSIPVFLFELPSLEHLDLSGNIYTYGRTFFSIILGVSANLLSGEIPWEIGNLNDVKSLNLSHNLFTGQIPATFGNMSAIESLDLSNNKLRGSIPWQLTKLRWLEVFSVAYGNLSGCILSSGQFNSFSAESYVWATLTFTMYHRGTCALPRQSPWKKKLWRRHLTTRSLIYIISASSFVLAFWATVWFMFFHSFGQHMNVWFYNCGSITTSIGSVFVLFFFLLASSYVQT
jgi:Leucine-rich repeat (LRR) protein